MNELSENIGPNPDYYDTPGNESKEHFYLKQIAKIYLKSKYNCKYIGSEIYLGKSIDKSIKKEYPDIPYNDKKITDAVGIEDRKLKHMGHRGIIRNIEVKVSKSDFRSGYSIMGDYNYIITVKNRLDDINIPKPVGLIEVDFDKFDVYDLKSRGMGIKGVELVKYPKRLNDKNYIAGSHKKYVDWVIKKIAQKHTNKDIYNNPWIWW